ncbi:MAG: LLM class F420-dependent oxidoreductase [Dehalococcoidia bacterium]
MRFGFWPAPSNTWEDTLELSRHAEATAWDSVWYADHFMPNAEDTSPPVGECWTTITALAALVPRVRLGHLVVGNTYRHPPILAKMAAGVDIISGGRLVLGLGAGWQDNEHAAYGIPFYTLGERLRRLDEACHVIKSLLTNDKTDFDGRYYQLKDAPLAPKPVQDPLPLLIGGGGEKMTLKIAAKYADEWNVWGTPEVLQQKMSVLDAHCADVGRDPSEIKRTAVALLVHTDDQDTIDRTARSGRPLIAGNTDQVRGIVQQHIDLGVHEIIVPDFNLGRTNEAKKEAMDRFMQEVASEFP